MTKDLQDRAVSNEREYFDNCIAKGNIDITSVIKWIKPSFQDDPSLSPFISFSKGIFSEFYLILAFVSLLSPSCSIQFPSTFLFDFRRLNNFRKDFRDLVSVQLCLLLYRELAMSLHLRSTPPSSISVNAVRREILSILCDLPESTKYTLASPTLALQIALRATQHGQPTAVVPVARLVNVAQGWIDLNVVDAGGKLFSLAEKRVREYHIHHLISAQTCCIAQTQPRNCESKGRVMWAIGTESAMWMLGERMHRVATFHWTVFGDVYIKGGEE